VAIDDHQAVHIVDNLVDSDASLAAFRRRGRWLVPAPREYDDIPGTFVFDGRRSRRGYGLNKFLMSLNDPANRDAFRADEAGYLDGFRLDEAQREAVLDRDWLGLLEVGGNVYYTYKLAACDGMTFQDLAARQTGMSRDEFTRMMLAGGRGIDGNRRTGEAAGGKG
jgi:protocatechuate 4,5-dioxygenase, alpha chain